MAQLMDLEPLFADGYHNAFTDLLYWQGHYYLTFRTAQSHSIETPGDIRVYRSADLSTWTQCAHFDTGGDDRDPKLIDGGTRLGVLFGTFYPRWKGRSRPNAETDLISCIAVSRDGLSWSTPHQVFGPNYWLWRILPTPEGFYGAAYHFPSSRPHQGAIDLLFSEDLFNWRLKTRMRAGDDLSEPALYRPKPDILCCIIRAKEPRNHSWIGRSPAPYDRWSWTDLGAMIHAPVVLKKNDRWLVAGRSQEEDLPDGAFQRFVAKPTAHTTLWAVEDTGLAHLITVPSAGDCSYCGLADGPNGEILMSYYSQHQRLPLPADPPTPADIFLARLSL
jgi:hypothetical protein